MSGENGKKRQGHFVMTAAGAMALILLMWPASTSAQSKKLRIEAVRCSVHLDPDAKSPVVATLFQGDTVTLASPVKSRTSWFYVYVTSAASGKSRAGYVLESEVSKLYSDLKTLQISAGNESDASSKWDFSGAYRPVPKWGTAIETVLQAEGSPDGEEYAEGRKVIKYLRRAAARRCLVEYVFDDEGLRATRWLVLENYNDAKLAFGDYGKIKDRLAAEFGPELETAPLQPADFAAGASGPGSGRREIRSSWNIPGAELSVILAERENRIALSVHVSGPNRKASS